MGQQITVTKQSQPRDGVVRFEVNRTLTGMSHERYVAGSTVSGDRPADLLARRLFERGGVRAVHVYSNIITIEFEPGASADGIDELITNLYLHYRPGVEPSYP